jgi:hypothetical protein
MFSSWITLPQRSRSLQMSVVTSCGGSARTAPLAGEAEVETQPATLPIEVPRAQGSASGTQYKIREMC